MSTRPRKAWLMSVRSQGESGRWMLVVSRAAATATPFNLQDACLLWKDPVSSHLFGTKAPVSLIQDRWSIDNDMMLSLGVVF